MNGCCLLLAVFLQICHQHSWAQNPCQVLQAYAWGYSEINTKFLFLSSFQTLQIWINKNCEKKIHFVIFVWNPHISRTCMWKTSPGTVSADPRFDPSVSLSSCAPDDPAFEWIRKTSNEKDSVGTHASSAIDGRKFMDRQPLMVGNSWLMILEAPFFGGVGQHLATYFFAMRLPWFWERQSEVLKDELWTLDVFVAFCQFSLGKHVQVHTWIHSIEAEFGVFFVVW